MKSTAKETILGWVIIGVIVLGVRGFMGGEQTGVVRTEDCRTQVSIEPSDFMTWYHTFTCTTDTAGSKVCAYVTTSGDRGVCDAAFVYYKPAPVPAQPPHPRATLTPAELAQQVAQRSAYEAMAEWIAGGLVAWMAVGWLVWWGWRKWHARPTAPAPAPDDEPAPTEAQATEIMAALKRGMEIAKKDRS